MWFKQAFYILQRNNHTLSLRLHPILLSKCQACNVKLHLSSNVSSVRLHTYNYEGQLKQCINNMDLDSPQTPNFTGLKDFPTGIYKNTGPPRVRLIHLKDELPYIPEKEEYRDSGIFFSSLDSTPEPREADANFLEIGSDSTEGSENVSIDEGKEVICSPDLDFESEVGPNSKLEPFFSPLKSDKLKLDDLSAGPPILDLTKLMMQPIRSTPVPNKLQKKSLLPDNLLNKVSDVVRNKIESGEQVGSWTTEDEIRIGDTTNNSNDEKLQCDRLRLEEGDIFAIDVFEDLPQGPGKKNKERAKKRKSVSSSDTKPPKKKEKKLIPNYFVAVQITNPEIHNHVRAVQNHVEAAKSSLRAAFIPTPTLHLTLHTSHLANDDDITRAKAALDQCQESVESLWIGGHPPLLHVVGLGSFRDAVVFSKVEESSDLDVLSEIADLIQKCHQRNEIPSTDDRSFKPHITVMKLSKARGLHKKGIKKIDPRLYQTFSKCEFGWQRVLGLQLCSMHKPKDSNGYYHVEHAVSFNLPEGEPTDGGAGRTANFQPQPLMADPINSVFKLQNELNWHFNVPNDQL